MMPSGAQGKAKPLTYHGYNINALKYVDFTYQMIIIFNAKLLSFIRI